MEVEPPSPGLYDNLWCYMTFDLVVFTSGTDATHADHIETIKSRMYVGVRDDGRFVPGELGMGLVEGGCHHSIL